MDNPKPKAEQKPSIKANPDTFGLVVQAVFDTQRQLGEMMQDLKTLNVNHEKQHQDNLELQAKMAKVTLTMKFGWSLLVTIGLGAAWTILRIWELVIPLLQTKLGLPIR